MIEIVALHALWGASIPISKQLLNLASPFIVTPLRLITSGLLLIGVHRVRTGTFGLGNQQFWWFNSQIIVAVYARYILRNWGLSNMPAVKMAFLFNIAPFVTALFSYIALKERLSGKQWLGLSIGFLGIIPIMITSSPAELSFGEFFYISTPELAIIIAVCINAYAMIISRRLINEHKQSVVLSNGVRTLGAGIIALVTLPFIETSYTIENPLEFTALLSLVILLSNVICHNFHLYLYRYYTVTFLSFTDFISPLFTAFYSWLFLHEIITWHYFVSVIVVFAGLYLFYSDELKTVRAA